MVWTKKQQVVALSSAESELSKRGEGPGNTMHAESAPGCLGNDVPGQSQGTGHGEACSHAKPLNTGGFQVRSVHHEEG